jgi:lipopolysaccharide export system permease protein
VFWGRIQRMILLELFKVFSLSLIALTGLILMAGVISEAMKNGFGPLQILALIPILLPSMLPYTVPTTTLFATCIVYGRLSADNEILALKSAGVHIFRVIWPALLLGILASAATMFLSLDFIPYTHFMLRSELGGDAEELLYATVRREGCIKHPKISYEIHAQGVEGRILQGVVFKRRGAKGEDYDLIAYAKEAELHVDCAQKQLLLDMKQCEIVRGNTLGSLDSQTMPVELAAEFFGAGPKLRATDMTWSEMAAFEAQFRTEQKKISLDIDSHQMQIDRNRATSGFADHVKHLRNERRVRDSYILAIHNERHMRPAFALGCFCFALIGCPVGIWLSKNDYLSAFVTCFLPIVTIYYPLMFCTINMARAGKIAPALAIYDADGLMMIAGLVLFWRLARH